MGWGCASDPHAEAAPERVSEGEREGEGEPGPADPGGPPLPPPDPPRLTDWTCPEGWGKTVAQPGRPWEFEACEPPEHGPCPGATVRWLGDAECMPIGSPCPPAGERFPTEAELRARAARFGEFDGPVVYVDPEAAPGGDGGRDSPFRDVKTPLPLPILGSGIGVEEAPDGSIVALSVGEHPGVVRAATRIAVLGACAEGTLVTAPPPELLEWDTAVVLLGAGGALLADISVRDVPLTGVSVHKNVAPVRVHAVATERTAGPGFFIGKNSAGGELTEVVVRDPAVRGMALQSLAGPLKIRRAVISGGQNFGIVAPGHRDGGPSAPVLLEDIVIRDTHGAEDGHWGWPLSVEPGADVTVRRALIEGGSEIGAFAQGDVDRRGAGLLRLEDVAIRDIRHEPGGRRGGGVAAGGAAEVVARRVSVSGVAGGGFTAWTQDLPDGSAEAVMDLQDVWIRDVRARTDEAKRSSTPAGIGALWGAAVEARRVLIEEADGIGVLGGTWRGRTPPSLALEDIVVAGGRAIRDSAEDFPFLALGIGLSVQYGASVTATRMHVEDSSDGGVVVWGCSESPIASPTPGCDVETEATLRHLSVIDTALAPCGLFPEGHDESCVLRGGQNYGGGHGVHVLLGGRLLLEDFLITGAEAVGLAVSHRGRLAATRGVSTANSIGARFLEPSAPGEPSADGSVIEFGEFYVFDNDTDFSRVELVIPDASDAFELDLDSDPGG